MPPDVQGNRPTSSGSQTASGLPVPGNIVKPSTSSGVVTSGKNDSAFRNGPAAEAGGAQQGGTYRVSGASTLGGFR